MKCALALALIVASASSAGAQQWTRMPLTDGFGWDADLALAPDGTLYIGYLGPGGNARVCRWNGSTWVALGSPSCSTSWQSTLFFSSASQPYYASRDYGSAGAFNVRRRESGAWHKLTICGAENGYDEILVASIHDPAGAVIDERDILGTGAGSPPPTSPGGKPARVVMLVNDGYPSSDPDYPNFPPELQDPYPTVVVGHEGTWGYVGQRRFSDAPASYLDLAVWEGHLWVVYSEQVGGGRITLKRFASADRVWETAATIPTAGGNNALTTAFGRLAVVTNSVGTLKAFALTETGFVQLGGAIDNHIDMGQQHWIQKVSCGHDSSGRLYVGYRRDDGHFKIRRLSNHDGQMVWSTAGESEDTMGSTRFVSMCVSQLTDEIYVAYTDELSRLVVVSKRVPN